MVWVAISRSRLKKMLLALLRRRRRQPSVVTVATVSTKTITTLNTSTVHTSIALLRMSSNNEDVILAVENTPTYKRTKQMIKDIKRISTPEQDAEDNDSQEGTVEGVISFV